MDKYISYSAIESLLDKEVGTPPELVYKDVYIRGLMEDIKSLPAADVAEEVGCKDCAYMDEGWCGLHDTPMEHSDYCSRGKMSV